MKYSDIKLVRVEAPIIQENISMIGKGLYGPWGLKKGRAGNNPPLEMLVTCKDRFMGRLPDDVAQRLVKESRKGTKHKILLRRVELRDDGSGLYDVYINITSHKPLGEEQKKADRAEREKWGKLHRERYDKGKWY